MEDSTLATMMHSRRVDALLLEIICELQLRLTRHDESKFLNPVEKAMFDEFTPKLRDSTFGSEEYKGYLRQMGDALREHYAGNRHHPEHFPNGVNDMTLIDVIEMFADWKAATERHADGDLAKSLLIQQERFGLSPQLVSILHNTAVEAGWL